MESNFSIFTQDDIHKVEGGNINSDYSFIEESESEAEDINANEPEYYDSFGMKLNTYTYKNLTLIKDNGRTEKDDETIAEKLIKETNVLLDKLRKIKIGNIVTINRLIETSLGFANGVGASKKLLDAYSKPSKRILNFLYKLDKERFLINFKPQ